MLADSSLSVLRLRPPIRSVPSFTTTIVIGDAAFARERLVQTLGQLAE
jgi:hypothetical protein